MSGFSFLKRKRIGRGSIKEAMDTLPAGICYFTKYGTIRLCNAQMYHLYHVLEGRDLQTLAELRQALENCGGRVKKTADGGYRFPDGKVWYYQESQITAGHGETYTETFFLEMTEYAAENARLKQDNAELARVNEKLRKMYERTADRIREQEYLAVKMKVHDDIGTSLHVIRRFLQKRGTEEDIEKQLSVLSVAVGTLAVEKRGGKSDDPYDQLLMRALALGVEIKLDGMLPVEPLLYELIVRAAGECVTNCVRHAHGSMVEIRIRAEAGGYIVTVTNDGEKPKGKIAEGGGLYTLRKRVENAGGEMILSHAPAFALTLKLFREEMNL